eukprot:gene22871-30044_t
MRLTELRRCRGGLNARAQPPDQVQINMEKFDYDSEVQSLRTHVGRIKEMSLAIEDERKQQGELINSMEDVMERAKMGLKRTMQRLNVAYTQAQSNHLLFLVLFAMVLLFGIYVLAKVYHFGRRIVG